MLKSPSPPEVLTSALSFEFHSTLEAIHAEIASLQKDLDSFDYSQLRAIAVKPETELGSQIFFRASDSAVKQLIAIFANRLLFSADPALRHDFSHLLNWSVTLLPQVTVLADTLLRFKQQIQAVENKYFASHEHGSFLAQLRNNDTWVIHFHFIIEQYLEREMPDVSLNDYKNFIKNVQILGKTVCEWFLLHASDAADRYATLGKRNTKTLKPFSDTNGSSYGPQRRALLPIARNKQEFAVFFKQLQKDELPTALSIPQNSVAAAPVSKPAGLILRKSFLKKI